MTADECIAEARPPSAPVPRPLALFQSTHVGA